MALDSPEEQSAIAYEGYGKIKFAGVLEANFQAHYRRRYLKHIRSALILSLIVFVFAGGLDLVIAQKDVYELWRLRYLYFLPAIFFIVIFSCSSQFVNYQQLCLMAIIIASGICLILMSVITARVESHVYYTGVLLTIMAGLTVTRMQLKGGMVVTVVLGLTVLIVYSGFSPASGRLLIADLFLLVAVCVISLLSNYNLERASRKNYLRRRLLYRRQEALEESNKYLRTIASSDSLTGVANRRIFDDVIVDEWRRALRGRYPVTLFMIDVDYFKNYNDTYGHQAGDECLKAIANVLSSFCRRPGDQLARYGGEEFALVLPQMVLEDAYLLGDEICQKIRLLGISHSSSQIADLITVSVGMATQVPEKEGAHDNLIRQADKNLYQAKNKGRDCTYCDRASTEAKLVQNSAFKMLGSK